jgi:hypothetical protein
VRYLPAVLRPALLLVVLVWTAAWPAAAAAPASSLETVAFAATVTGTQRTVVTGTRRSVDELGCTVRQSDVQRQTLAFASRVPGRLVAVRGRVSSARIDVTVAATGTKRRTLTTSGAAPECDVAPETTGSSCGAARFSGRTTVTMRSFGSVRLSGAPVRRRDTFRCRPALVPPRVFLVASEGHFPAALLTDRTAARVILRGDARFTDTYESGARRVTTVQWTVTLRRAD